MVFFGSLLAAPGTTPGQIQSRAAMAVGQQNLFQQQLVAMQQELINRTLQYKTEQEHILEAQQAQAAQTAAAQQAAVAPIVGPPITPAIQPNSSIHTSPLGDQSDPYLAKRKLLGN